MNGVPNGPRVVEKMIVVPAFPGSIPEEVYLFESFVFDVTKAEPFVPACSKMARILNGKLLPFLTELN